MSNIPNYEQWAKMNDYLNNIAVSLGAEVDVSTWAGVQKAVRLGIAPDLFPLGTKLKINHSVYGECVFDVVAHDHFKSSADKNSHTMTLMCNNAIAMMPFDAQEAFYYAEKSLSPGFYTFTLTDSFYAWEAGTYKFTLMRGLPAGGQLCISGSSDSALTNAKVISYENGTATTAYETCSIEFNSGGEPLGTFGVELNHIQRVAFGSNNYKESAIRQFLNSSNAAGSVWSPQTKFDRPPSWFTTTAGFAKGLDSDFLNVVGEVIVPCAANNTYESPDSTIVKGSKYTLLDKFYLASQMELFGDSKDATADDSILLPYFKGAVNTDRIKYADGVVKNWWTRTADKWSAAVEHIVHSNGGLQHGSPLYDVGCVPVCAIV